MDRVTTRPGPDAVRSAAWDPWSGRLVAAVALGVLTASAGCSNTTPAGARVVVAGDSITALAQPAISSALVPRYSVTYEFRIGTRIDQIVPLIQSDLRRNGIPSALVENLGTNDALQTGGREDELASWNLLLSTVQPVGCVVLTTLNTTADVRSSGDRASRINARIAMLVSSDPRKYKVVDWNGLLATLSVQELRTYLLTDLTHETATGARWIAAADLAALATCGTSKEPPPPARTGR